MPRLVCGQVARLDEGARASVRVRRVGPYPCAFDARWLWLGALVGLAACKSEPARPIACWDEDGDGRGSHCALGPDCDDFDAQHGSECPDAGPGPDCEADPAAPHCPCLRADRRECFAAAAESSGVGVCRAGIQRCRDDRWSECEGSVLPSLELCNDLDDDCDGVADEGVQSPCGGCNSECMGGVWGPPAAPFEVEPPLAVSELGELTLQRTQRDALTLWVPNTDEGSVSKIDAAIAGEVERYRTRGGRPIRVAVDQRGDAWVLDGSVEARAQLTKIAGSRARCRDRDGDGLQTSGGSDDARAPGADDCVLLELPLGAAGDDARALALDAAPAPDSERAGNVWIGLAGAGRLLALDGESGAELLSLPLGDFHAHAGTFDDGGVLWLIDRAGYLARVDPAALPPALERLSVPFACFALDGLSIDARGQLLLTGEGCEAVMTYDPRRRSWRHAPVPELRTPRAAAALAEHSWLVYASGEIARVSRDPLAIDPARSLAMAEIAPYETIALSADSTGQLWAISTQGGPDGRGLATRFDPARAQVTAQVAVGVGPRGGGDLSGFEHSSAYAREGVASYVFYGCDRAVDESARQTFTEWRTLHIASTLGAYASVDVELRRAAAAAALSEEAFTRVTRLPDSRSAFALDVPPGGVVEVRLTLRSPAAIGAPRIARVGLEWTCQGPD
jgi:sugar lactone lactonase YvrE